MRKLVAVSVQTQRRLMSVNMPRNFGEYPPGFAARQRYDRRWLPYGGWKLFVGRGHWE